MWISRGVDVSCALATTHLDEDNILGYGDEYVIDPVIGIR